MIPIRQPQAMEAVGSGIVDVEVKPRLDAKSFEAFLPFRTCIRPKAGLNL
jgi:hypothetical protein